MSNENYLSRRKMLTTTASMAAALPFASALNVFGSTAQGPRTVSHDDPWLGLKMGVATYTFRKLSLDATIKAVNRLGIKYVSIKDFHCPLKSTTEERKAVAQKFKDAGITPLSCGNITMTDEASIRLAFEYARDLGLPTIVCTPEPSSMPILDKMVKEFNIKLAIHNHGPEDKKYPAPSDVWKAVQNYDQRIGLCIDVGHTARAQEDPAETIVKYRARLYDLHIKDITD
ncbi:MAG TPA: sugar phosphate isomerase/epimerase, partial [Blastocatellia bacterium]|nr:sugar phosphate isomerase/epimerase [Blastocatellia bacterium]